jgi:hypothetical protein
LPEHRLLGYHKFQHFRQWLRSELRTYVRDVLAEPTPQAEVFGDHARLSHLFDCHEAGSRNYFAAIDKALTLKIIETRLFRESPGLSRPQDNTLVRLEHCGQPQTARSSAAISTAHG